jgi:hypothetical protein
LDGGSAYRKTATYTQNKRKQTCMPRVRFEPTIPAFERDKIVHALDLAATVIGMFFFVTLNINLMFKMAFYAVLSSFAETIIGLPVLSVFSCRFSDRVVIHSGTKELYPFSSWTSDVRLPVG